MDILYCGDKNISDGLILSVMSVADNTDKIIRIHILTAGFEANGKRYEPVEEKLTRLLDEYVKEKNYNSSVKLYDVSEHFLSELPIANMETRFTPCCMLRLFADKVKELPDKLLYLDNDVLCRADISALFNADIEGYELAGVRDYYGRWFFGYNYLNSGVLLLNLGEIRKNGLFERCRRMCRNDKMFMPDQSAINKILRRKKVLPRRFNEQRKLKKDTLLQHFTTSFRFFPWFRSVSVKPWQTEQMHKTLKLYEYDALLSKYLIYKEGLIR